MRDENGNIILRDKVPAFNCIPFSKEKFLSFNIGDLRFIDSFRFMATSLDKLVGNLYDDGEDKFKNFNFIKKRNTRMIMRRCVKKDTTRMTGLMILKNLNIKDYLRDIIFIIN